MVRLHSSLHSGYQSHMPCTRQSGDSLLLTGGCHPESNSHDGVSTQSSRPTTIFHRDEYRTGITGRVLNRCSDVAVPIRG